MMNSKKIIPDVIRTTENGDSERPESEMLEVKPESPFTHETTLLTLETLKEWLMNLAISQTSSPAAMKRELKADPENNLIMMEVLRKYSDKYLTLFSRIAAVEARLSTTDTIASPEELSPILDSLRSIEKGLVQIIPPFKNMLHDFSFFINHQNHAARYQLMINLGVDFETRNHLGSTPLQHAAGENLFWAVKVLVKSGADLNALSNKSTAFGMILRMSVPEYLVGEKYNLIQEIIDSQKINLNKSAVSGKTPLSYASSINDERLTAILQKAREQTAPTHSRKTFLSFFSFGASRRQNQISPTTLKPSW